MSKIVKLSAAILFAAPLVAFKVLIGVLPGIWLWMCGFEWMQLTLHFFGARSKASVHGDAAWATLRQLKRAGNLDMRGFYVARVKGVPVATHRERSLLMMAPPGEGKSQTILAGLHAIRLIPQNEKPTLIISDSANELYRKGAPDLAAQGYDVFNVDLVRPEQGGKYDVLSFPRLDPRYLETDVHIMSYGLITPDSEDRNPHFRNFARQMLSDAIVLNMKYEGNNKTIGQISDEIIDDDLREKMIVRMKKYGAEFSAIKTFDKLGKNEGPGMLSTSLNHLAPWRLPNVKEVGTFGSYIDGRFQRGWDWQKVFTHNKPCAVFIRTGLNIGGGEFARMMICNAINTARRHWDANEVPLARPLRLIIDEAASLGNLVALTDAHNELRKAHVTAMACFLSYSSLMSIYGKEHGETLWNGCDHLVYGGGKDMRTYGEYSKMLGENTVETESSNTGDHGKSEGKSQMARRLMKDDELRRLAVENCIGVLGRLSTFGKKPYWFKRDVAKYL